MDDLLKATPGSTSLMRFSALLCVVTGCLIALSFSGVVCYKIIVTDDLAKLSGLVAIGGFMSGIILSLVGGSLLPKAVQSFSEQKTEQVKIQDGVIK